MWDIVQYTRRGERHKIGKLRCQDAVFSQEEDGIYAVTLADGAGGSDCARIGAELSCRVLAELLIGHFEELYPMEEPLIRFQVITNIQSNLYGLCDAYDLDIQEFQSTLLGVAVDANTGRYLALHLGDGQIRIRMDDGGHILSHPENGINRSKTCLTSQTSAGEHIRVYKGELHGIYEFMLESDGWDEMEVPREHTAENLRESAQKMMLQDDVSFIALRRK